MPSCKPIILTSHSPLTWQVVASSRFLGSQCIGTNPLVTSMRSKTTTLPVESDLLVDLTLHNVSASLIAEFAQQIVKPYYGGNLNAAVQDLIQKALLEQDFVHSHITHVRSKPES